MAELGYALSGEEHASDDLVDYAVRAEEVGFDHALISDHFHPWVSRQGEASFIWSTLGAIARETEALEVGTGVTCPFQRYHPAIVAQAAGTVAEMFDDRFFLGVGTGENLNEHVTGEDWPPFEVRLARLTEAVEAIRELFTGQTVTYRGDHVTVEDAKLFTLPDDPPPIYAAGSGQQSASAASDIGDGFISTAPKAELVDAYGGDGPTYGQMTVCWAESEQEARETAYEVWPNSAITGELSAELETVAHFEQASQMVSEDDVASSMALGSDADAHVEKFQEFADAGFDHVYVHQVGPDQDGFFEFYESEVLPSIS